MRRLPAPRREPSTQLRGPVTFPPVTCPAENTWLAFVGGALDAPALNAIELHLDQCQSCRTIYAEVAREDRTRSAAAALPELPRAAELPRGTVVGRYVVLDTIGRGGMGVVYKAFDPELDRAIALKLVGLGHLGADPARARIRLLREAKALAQLSHPNVVAVHDVGTHDDELFVAMEFIAGCTLRSWLRDRPRSPREVLGVFSAAAAGLASAHRAGIIHRDFKPENVMIGNDGRVRVVDFGLARAGMTDELAGVGAIVGTPAYMAPEQDLGREVDARSDQFSLCVALYEALFGQRPFAGESYAEIARHRLAGEVRPAPKVAGLSSKLRRAVLQGLRVDPEERHPTIAALLGVLGAGRRTGRIRAAVTALAVTTVIAGGWAAWLATHAPPTVEQSCALAADDLYRVWNAGRRDALRIALTGFAVTDAAGVTDRVGAQIDRWSAEWSARRTALCELSMRSDHDQSAKAVEQLHCLERRLTHLDAALSACTLAGSREVALGVETIMAELPSPRSCEQPAPTVVTEPVRARWQPMIEDLIRAQRALSQGEPDAALRSGAKVVDRARATHDVEPLASGLLAVGEAQVMLGQLPAARDSLRDAIRAATQVRDEEVVLDGWTDLVALATLDRRFDAAFDAAVLAAELAAMRVPAEEPGQAQLALALGTTALLRGDLERAGTELPRALERWSQARDATQRAELVRAERALGLLYAYRGAWRDARAHLDRALAGAAQLSVSGVERGLTLAALGELAGLQRDDTEAAARYDGALAALETAGAAGRTLLPTVWIDDATVRARAGRCDLAAPLLTHARDLAQAIYGGDSVLVAAALLGEARCALDRGDARNAVAVLERASQLAVAASASPLQRAAIDFARARALTSTGASARGIALAVRARDSFATVPGAQADRDEVDDWLAVHRKPP